MGWSLIPSILRPDYTWPRPMQYPLLKTTPPLPRVQGKLSLISWGFIHRALIRFSEWYCSWFGFFPDPNIAQLPFGLVLKWTGRSSIEEAVAMQMARAAGMPVPKVLNCGWHLDAPYTREFSILMTRLPGVDLVNMRENWTWTPRDHGYKSSRSVYILCVNGLHRMKTPYALLLEPLFEAHEFPTISWAPFQLRRSSTTIFLVQLQATASILGQSLMRPCQRQISYDSVPTDSRLLMVI